MSGQKDFVAFNFFPVLDGLPPKVEVVAAYGSNVYVGTGDGVVYMYRFVQAGSTWTSTLEVKKQVTTKKIERLDVVPKLNQIVVLSGRSVHPLSAADPTFFCR